MRKLLRVQEPRLVADARLVAIGRALKAASAVAMLSIFLWTITSTNHSSQGGQLETQPTSTAAASTSEVELYQSSSTQRQSEGEPYQYGITQRQVPLDSRYAELCRRHPPPPPNPSSVTWKQRMFQRDRRGVRMLVGGAGPPSIEALTKHLACPIWVNDKYRLAFVRIQKTGTSTILERFTECGSSGARPDTCMRALPPCTPGQPPRSLEGYFVFATVRNPYARLVSLHSYLTVGSRGPDGNQRAGCPRLPWRHFCIDPTSVARYCPSRPGCCRGPHQRFKPELYFKFTRQQARCLTGAGGGWAVDYLLRVERLNADFGAMVELINRQRNSGASGDRGDGGARSSSSWGSKGRSARGMEGGAEAATFEAGVGVVAKRSGGFLAPPLPEWLVGELPVGNPSQRSNDSFLALFHGQHESCAAHAQQVFADDFRLLGYSMDLG